MIFTENEDKDHKFGLAVVVVIKGSKQSSGIFLVLDLGN